MLRPEGRMKWFRPIAKILILFILISGLPLHVHASDSDPIVYDFRKLAFPGETTGFPGQEVQEGWSMLELPTVRPVLGFQPTFGVNIGTTQIGMSRSFLFDVPTAGTYLIKFRALVSAAGGIGELRINGKAIGTYDYYAETPAYVTRTLRIVELEQGTHTLDLVVVGRNPLSAEGTAGHRMTASQFTLEPLAEFPVIDSIVVNSSNQDELYIGSESQLSVYGARMDGTPIDLGNREVTYMSEDPSIVSVDSQSGTLVAVSVGETNVVATVDDNGTNITQAFPVKVHSRAGKEPIIYDFRNVGFPDQPLYTQPGWEMIGLPTDQPVLGFQPSFGLYIGTTRIGQSRSFRFVVPESGMYHISFRGQKYQAGGIAELQIDGRPIGTFDFFTPTGVHYNTESIRITNLEQGEHILTLEVAGKHPDAPDNPAYRMGPSQFTLAMIAELSDLGEVSLSIEQSELFIGSETSLRVDGTTTDGVPSDLFSEQVTFHSDNLDVVTVDAETGKVTAVGTGTANVSVTVQSNGNTLSSTLLVGVQPIHNVKTRSTFYTEEKINAARHNIAEYDWADGLKDNAVLKAERYLSQGLDFLWELVPPQSLPRSYAVNELLGSPLHGKEIDKYGVYPYLYDPINDPWKIIDPIDGKKYPTNDFGAYYRSGLNEQGIFDPMLADKSLLYNEEYPDPNHPLHKWGVDDGLGWIDEDGNRYTFIAYYVHWAIWGSRGEGMIQDALRSLRDAYLYTGNVKYARAGTVLLDRVADIYPSLDISHYSASTYRNSHGGTNLGKALGSIWETFLVKDFLYAYDAFYPMMDDPELLTYLSDKSREYQLGPLKFTADGIRKNIEDGIVKLIYPSVKEAQILGNNGMHQSALALAAVVYDSLPETKEWLDFVFQSGGLLHAPFRVTGGNFGATLVNDVDRDGSGNEASPGYNRLWLTYFLETADILKGYDLYSGADLYDNPKFYRMFQALYPLILSEKYMPQIGDTANTGNPGLYLDKTLMARAFMQYGDPIFAQLTHFLNNNSTVGIRADIFTPQPEEVATAIEQVVNDQGPLDLPSVNLTGYGFTALRDGVHQKKSFGLAYPFVNMPIENQTASTTTLDSNGALEFAAQGPGESISFTFDVAESKLYEIGLKPFNSIFNGGYGIYKVSLDGEEIAEVNFFGTTSDYEPLVSKVLTPGTHHITFESVDKHPNSTGYKMGLFELVLLDEQDLDDKNNYTNDTNTLRDVWLYYGRNTGHGHKDTLNLGMHAFGLDLMPDLGYPEFADSRDMHRFEWVNNTISHNTVVVDESKQQPQWVADPKHFDDKGNVQLIDVEAPLVYPQADVYRRTTAMIRVDDEHSYAVDFFRVKGGEDHLYSFHGPEGDVIAEGLNLTAQTDQNGDYVGTYAGPDVPFAQRPADDSVAGSGYMGPGYHYLENVDRDELPGAQFSVDWSVKDTWNVYGKGFGAPTDVHLRLTMLGELDGVALADGVPPRNKPGNPASLKYVLAHRSGVDLDSLFTSVIEPYKEERYITSIQPAIMKVDGEVVTGHKAKAVKVELANGRTDYIAYSSEPDLIYTIDDRIQFSGFFGVYSEVGGQQVYEYVNDGRFFKRMDAMEDSNEMDSLIPARLAGTIVDFTKELSMVNSIDVEMDLIGLESNDVVGYWIYVENDGERNAAYKIKGIERLDNTHYRLDLGDITLIRSFVDANDFSKGYIYDVAGGAEFVIPLAKELFYELDEMPPTITSIQEIVESNQHEIYVETAYHTLGLHLNAVAHFEQQGNAEKVIQHMGSFKLLLDHHRDADMISEHIYNLLYNATQALIQGYE